MKTAMIKNRKLYDKIALQDRIRRLQGLSLAKGAKELAALVDFGWRFQTKRKRPSPVALIYLLKRG